MAKGGEGGRGGDREGGALKTALVVGGALVLAWLTVETAFKPFLDGVRRSIARSDRSRDPDDSIARSDPNRDPGDRADDAPAANPSSSPEEGDEGKPSAD